jgi:pimeloyl-ACP methyl ester carboxylesterase
MTSSRSRLRATLVCAGLLTLGLTGAPAGAVADDGHAGTLAWADCGDGFQCATASVPLDYGDRQEGRTDLPVARLPAKDQAHRLGSLFVDFGGPGDATAETLRAGAVVVFAAFNERYDIIGFDPRGTGGPDAIDCKVDQETQGAYAQPFPRPETLDREAVLARSQAYADRCRKLNRHILPYVSTANVARDMDFIRKALGESKVNYFGFSYGTFLGATYESLFPKRVGRFVLDGALDADQFLSDPVQGLREQSKAFEVALGRFFQACAVHQDVCGGFGGEDPWAAFDDLVASMNATPLPAGGPDPRPVDGDDLLTAAFGTLYAKQAWPFLAQALAQAAGGDGTLVRVLTDGFYFRNDDGTFDPLSDRYYTISSVEGRFPEGVDQYFKMISDDYQLFDHAWFNAGPFDLTASLLDVKPVDAYYGPFSAPDDAPTTLVVGTTYDPATPYKGAKRLVAELGNARLLTMRGDGHTAYFGNSPCIDQAVEAYMNEGTLPAAGTACRQEVPFAPPAPAASQQGAARKRSQLRALHLPVRSGVPMAVSGQ